MSESFSRPTKKLTKKQLKANAFRSKKKIKDLLNEEDRRSIPEDDDDDDDEELTNSKKKKRQKLDKGSSSISKDRSSSSKTKKTNSNNHDEEDEDEDENDESSSNGNDQSKLGTAAKRRKRKKLSKLKYLNDDGSKKSSSKLILFIGNLPFDITREEIQKFFSEHCDEEPMVRLMTDKSKPEKTSEQDPKKSKKTTKGYGFIEFKTSAALQKALRLHHTPIKSNQSKPRKINIELTAGGGGNSESRQKKINQSKERLSKQREKRIEKNIKSETEKKLKGDNNNDGGYDDSKDPNFDVSVKLGSKKRKIRDGGEDDSRADWGSKAPSDGNSNVSKPLKSTRRENRPFMSGANAIRLG